MGTAPSSNSLVMIIFYFVIDELEYSSFLSFRGPFSVPLACFPLIFFMIVKDNYNIFLLPKNGKLAWSAYTYPVLLCFSCQKGQVSLSH